MIPAHTRVAMLALRAIRARLLGRRIPMAVSWLVTGRCDGACRYCGIPAQRFQELETGEVMGALRTMAEMGTVRINFGGGEPLLRADLPEILRECRELGIDAAINTNGTLLPDRIDELGAVSAVNVSLDGREEAHDALRGRGSHARAITAATVARAHAIPVCLLCTVGSLNAGEPPFVVETAERLGARAQFQPATETVLYGTAPNPVRPAPEAFRAAMDNLILLKRRGAPITNSLAGLAVLRRWPRLPRVPCAGGRIFCAIDPEGYLRVCNEVAGRQPRCSIRDVGFREAFRNLPTPPGCARCQCAALLEINLASALHVGALHNLRFLV